jgi:hypothetical protein
VLPTLQREINESPFPYVKCARLFALAKTLKKKGESLVDMKLLVSDRIHFSKCSELMIILSDCRTEFELAYFEKHFFPTNKKFMVQT